MSERDNNTVPPDEMLVAYIDGELNTADRDAVEAMLCRDQRTKERLDLLGLGDPPLREAFQPLLEAAPTARLAAMLAAIQPSQARPERHPQLSRRGFLGLLDLFGLARLCGGFSHRAVLSKKGSRRSSIKTAKAGSCGATSCSPSSPAVQTPNV